MSDDPVLIEAAVNGGTTRSRNPNVPVTPEEIGADVPETLRLFDQTFPVNEEIPLTSDLPRVKLGAMAVAAGLTGAGIIAVILAFTR